MKMPMSDGALQLIAWMACRRFGAIGDGLFNAANFSNAWNEATGLKTTLDGFWVEAMLTGRPWVRVKGDGYYQLEGKA